MNKILLLLFFLISSASFGCDLCNMYECNAYQNKSFVGVFYRYRVFHGYTHLNEPHSFFTTPSQIGANRRILHEPEDAGLAVNKSKYDYERYQTFELRGNYSIKNKINIQLILPYRKNEVFYKQVIDWPNPQKDSLITVQGWGDLMLAADYVKFIQKGKFRHYIRPGFAVKLPTGNCHKKGLGSQAYDPTIQTGTGAFDFLLRFNYQVGYNNWGVNTAASYKFSTKGNNDYTFGKSLNLNLDVYHRFQFRDLAIIPKIGTYVEQAQTDKRKKESQRGTGGTSFFLNAGTDLNLKAFTLQLLFQAPVSERLNNNQIGNAGRFTSGIIYSFN